MDADLRRAVARDLPVALEYLAEKLVARVGSVDLLREKHLAEALKTGLEAQTRARVTVGTVVPIPGWPSLGRSGVDVAVMTGAARYPVLLEAKWCHSGRDKIYEAIWDLFKVALGLRRPETHASFLVTGAPSAMWPTGFCRDLFEGGTFTPEELCSRMLPWGRQPRWLAWDDLLYGGKDRFPDEVPAVIQTEPVVEPADIPVTPKWTIRAVSISVPESIPVPFTGGWPHGSRPANARHPNSF
jgi:hypothetical protein